MFKSVEGVTVMCYCSESTEEFRTVVKSIFFPLGPQLNKIRSLCFIACQAGGQDASNLFDVFGRQLSGSGKMLMCLDKMRDGNYTSRLWCIFEAWGMLLGGLAEIQEKHPKICLIMF